MSQQLFLFTDMLTLLRRILLEEDEANSAWNAASGTPYLKRMLNLSNEEFCSAFPAQWEEAEYEFNNVYTTVSATSSGSTLNVTSTSGWGPGDYGWIWDDTNFERFQVSSVNSSGSTITTVSALTNGFVATDELTRESYDLPYDFHQMYALRIVTDGYERRLKPLMPHKFTHNHPKYKSAGTPRNYIRWNWNTRREPTSGTGTCASGTSTTVVKYAAAGVGTDYYKNWILVNVTHSAASFITSSSVSSGVTTFNLLTSIASQASGDIFYVQRNLPQLLFNTLSDQSYTFNVRYYRWPSRLINNYDMPETPGTFIPAVVAGAAGYAFAQDGQFNKAQTWFRVFAEGLERAFQLMGDKRGFDGSPAAVYVGDDYAGSDDAD